MNLELDSERMKDMNLEKSHPNSCEEPSFQKSPKYEKVFIYTLSDPRTGFVRYVGKAFVLKKRFYAHWHDKKNTPKTGWIKSLKKIGLKPIMEVLEEIITDDPQVWKEAERFWITSLRCAGCNLTNLDAGGYGGGRAALSTRMKISEFSRNRRHSDDVKRQISLSCKARMTDEEKLRLRDKQIGIPKHTDEFKRKLAMLKTGKTRPEHVKKKLLAHSILTKFKRGFATADYQKDIVRSVLGITLDDSMIGCLPSSALAGTENPNCKLSESDVVAIRAEYAAGGITYKQLGAKFGVSHTVTRKIIIGKAWKHVTGPTPAPFA